MLAPDPNSAQIPLPMGPGEDGSSARPVRFLTRRSTYNRELGIDPVVYMPDVVRIVGRHRSTILRWIARKWFPAKSVPSEHPTGWLRSEIERWQRGQGSHTAGEHDGVTDQRGRESPNESTTTE